MRAALVTVAGGERRLAHARAGEGGAASRPPRRASVAVSITRPSRHQPTFVYDQNSPAGIGRGDIRGEPREGTVVLVLSAGEVELQPGAQRKPGAIRKKVTQGRALGPAVSAQLRHVRGHRIIQRQPACFRETSDHRRDHRLGQGSNAEERLGCDRLAGAHVCHSVVGGRGRPFAEDPDRRPGHRMPRSVLTEQSGQIALVHPTIVMTLLIDGLRARPVTRGQPTDRTSSWRARSP